MSRPGRAGAITGLAHLLLRLVRMELATNGGRTDLALTRRLFLSSKRTLYPVDSWPVECFLNDFEIEGPLSVVNPVGWRERLTDKQVVHDILSRSTPQIRMPVVAGLVVDGQSVPFGRAAAARPLIAKPVAGRGGRGVRRLEDGQAMPPRGTFLLEEPVEPHPYASAIFPGALNTVRVLVGRRSADTPPILLGAAHRFGTARSAPRDNFTAGGVVAHVDIKTGSMSGLLVSGFSRSRMVLDQHPETGAQVYGRVVPEWPEILAAALRCSEVLPWLVYAGFDIALSPEGPVLIEINASLPNPNLIQMHRPLLADPVAREFFRSTGVISPQRAREAAIAAAQRSV